MKNTEMIENAIGICNLGFKVVFYAIFAFVVFYGIKLWCCDTAENKRNRRTYTIIVKKQLIEISILACFSGLVINGLKEMFVVDILEMVSVWQYLKFVLTIILLKSFFEGKRLYNGIGYMNIIEKIKSGKSWYKSPENGLIEEIKRSKLNYTLEKEKLEILKNFAPVSLIPLIGGYVLEGKNINLDWNVSTIFFVIILAVYICSVWKCYRNIKFWKENEWYVKNELRDLKYKESDEYKEAFKLYKND